MESVAEVFLLKSGELTLEGRTPWGQLSFSGKRKGRGNVLNTDLTRKFSLRVSSKNFDDERHVS